MDLQGGGSPWGDIPSQSKAEDKKTAEESSQEASSSLTTPQSPPSSAARASRTPRKVSAHVTKLEPVGDANDPLGPLGDPSFSADDAHEQGPTPPRKESLVARNARITASQHLQRPDSSGSTGVRQGEQSSILASTPAEFDARGPPPPPPPGAQAVDARKRQIPPSVSVEQAAKPSFYITVGDPHKVGDLASSHTEYQVRTKTTSKAYSRPEFAVSRRYRDFLWLYNSLHSNNPGIVVPPPPEKQAVGRFETDFVESRRAALERMLNKIAAHPTLQLDADLKIFLESEAFNVDVKNKENREPDLGQSKGMFSSFGISVGGGGKFVEHDDWFHDRKVYLDALESQLRSLMKALDTVVSQRKGLSDAAAEFSESLHNLASVELSPSLSAPLEGLSELQLRIRELYDRQAQQDMLTLGITIDEYIRLIGSVKTAFAQRQKSYYTWHSVETEMQKKKNTRDKLMRQGKSQQDRINQVQAEVADSEKKVHQARLLFEDLGRVMRNELERFEREKVEDFKSGVETFLESAVEAQKELIELWETFLLQLEADDESNPYYTPASTSRTDGGRDEHEQEHQRSESSISATEQS